MSAPGSLQRAAVLAVPRRVAPTARPRPRLIGASLVVGLALVISIGAVAQASSVITHGSRTRPWVALTFDDGWSASRCEQIVRTLRAKRAPATFFINGAIIAREPARWRAMLDGFSVANHTRTHPWLTRLSSAGIRSEIASNEKLIEDILRRPMLKLMRPPYGAYDSRVVSIADSLGYRTILWDTSSGDTSAGTTTRSVIRNGSRGGNGAVVLMHCGPAVTPAAVGPIVDSYRARGYQLVDLAQMFGGASAAPTACRVRNLDTGITKRSLQRAANLASAGHRLAVQGTCRGATTIRKSLRIIGIESATSGAPSLVGKGSGSVVTVSSGATVMLRRLTIRGGNDPEGGGGIVNRGSLVLRDSTVRGNRTAGGGGGIRNVAGAILRLKGASVVRGNSAGKGGGVDNRGQLTLHGSSSIRANKAEEGGGAHNRGTLTLKDASSIRGNEANTAGGGVYNRGTLAMRHTGSIRRNQVTGVAGGGVYNDGGLFDGVVCAPDAGANVHDNLPDQCWP
jgi:peptidoglycan-N-acetylglucosamine deacetylase